MLKTKSDAAGTLIQDATNADIPGRAVSEATPVVTPIYHSTTYRLSSLEHYKDLCDEGGHAYARDSNPTCEAAEEAITELETGAGALVFGSGMGAITTSLLAMLKSGDHVVACNPIYGGTHRLLSKYLSLYSVQVDWVPLGSSVDDFRKRVKSNTKVLYGETPCNPLISILDLEEFGKLGQSLEGVVTMVDSTYGSPYLQQPHKYGIDLVVHSGTKYIGGHSDVTAGVVSTRTSELKETIHRWRTTIGTNLSPFDAALLQRGIKTLHLRMPRHSSTAQKVAEFLDSHSKVAKVHYPGLPNHPGHIVAKKQMKEFGGMIAFEMVGGLASAKTLVENVRVIVLALSLGGTESLIELPTLMTHESLSESEREQGGIRGGLVRLSVGLEEPELLIRDLRDALEKV